MTVQALIDSLLKIPDKNTPVVFDTEAARFMQHLVEVDGCYFDPEYEAAVGIAPYCTLTSRTSRQY